MLRVLSRCASLEFLPSTKSIRLQECVNDIDNGRNRMVAKKRNILLGTAMLVALVFAGVADAQVYRWRDAN